MKAAKCMSQARLAYIETHDNRDYYFLTLTVEVKIGGLSVEGIYNGGFVFCQIAGMPDD